MFDNAIVKKERFAIDVPKLTLWTVEEQGDK